VSDLFSDLPADEVSVYGRVPRAASRKADPPSSAEAAERMDRSGATGRHAAIVLELVRERPGSTAVELHKAQVKRFNLDRVEIGRRLDSLVKAGLVRKGEERQCSEKNTKMLTWWPVEGRAT
jgi:hypothetical protein